MFSIPRMLSFASALVLLPGCQSTTLISKVETVSGAYGNTDWIGVSDRRGLDKLQQVIAAADYEFHLDDEGELEPVNGSHRRPFKLPRIFMNGGGGQGQFPGFVVVQLHKLAQIDEVDAKVSCVNEFFFAQGADRVLVTGIRGSGRQIYSDRTKSDIKSAHSTAGNN